MRIFSKFNDYYDNVGFYSEDDRVWVRKTEFTNILLNGTNKYPYNKNREHGVKYKTELSQRSEELLADAFNTLPAIEKKGRFSTETKYDTDYINILGFCGKLYFVIMHYERREIVDSISAAYNDYSAYMDKTKTEKRFKKNEKPIHYSFFGIRQPFDEKGFKAWEDKYAQHPDLNKVFLELNTPIFILRPRKLHYQEKSGNLVINPCLKDYMIHNILHPYMTHQEIDMFLGNELANCENKELERSQELIRDSKGFDDWSFKQQGPKKRKRKK